VAFADASGTDINIGKCKTAVLLVPLLQVQKTPKLEDALLSLRKKSMCIQESTSVGLSRL
jgi:hypothetical protein